MRIASLVEIVLLAGMAILVRSSRDDLLLSNYELDAVYRYPDPGGVTGAATPPTRTDRVNSTC